MSPERASELLAGLAATRARIAAACAAAGRSPQEVSLVAVSKTFPLTDVDVLAGAGQRAFGESRAQECLPKATGRPDLQWHFLGRLQTNKARRIGAVCAAVHTVDRAEVIGPLARGAAGRSQALEVYLQVSLDGDPARGGADPTAVPELAAAVGDQAALRLAGVMAIAPLGAEPGAAFARLRTVSDALVRDHPGAGGISAGMSGDLEAAIAHGATCARVGSALFGGRAPLLG
jgi:pyridoxal phosphate enzyme (YggS family)